MKTVLFLALAVFSAGQEIRGKVVKEVMRELVTFPNYGVFSAKSPVTSWRCCPTRPPTTAFAERFVTDKNLAGDAANGVVEITVRKILNEIRPRGHPLARRPT